MEDLLQPCIKVQAEEVEQRLKKLRSLSRLKDCARNPTKANGLHSLKGMAQGTCIYEIKYVFPTLIPSSPLTLPTEATESDISRGPKGIDLPLPNQEFLCTTWRRGLHSQVGGSNEQWSNNLTNVSLSWIVAQLKGSGLVSFDKDQLKRVFASDGTAKTTFQSRKDGNCHNFHRKFNVSACQPLRYPTESLL